jgi:histidinol-phosphate aminotransferase
MGPEEICRMRGYPGALSRLGMNESPFGPAPAVLAALHEDLAEGAARYGDPSVYDLRHRIALEHGVDVRNVLVGAGIDDILRMAALTLLDGRTAVATDGQYPTFADQVQAHGRDLRTTAYRPDGHIDLDGYAGVVRQFPSSLVFLPNPDNPSGTHHAHDDIRSFADALPDEAILLYDEAYAAFAGKTAPFEGVHPRVIRLRTFSKEYGLAGLRVGFAIAPAELIDALERGRLKYGIGRLAQNAALRALGETEWRDFVVAETFRGKQFYYDLADDLGIGVIRSSTNFVLFDLLDAGRAERAAEHLLGAGIHVRRPAKAPLNRCIRVSVGSSDAMNFFARCMQSALCARA